MKIKVTHCEFCHGTTRVIDVKTEYGRDVTHLGDYCFDCDGTGHVVIEDVLMCVNCKRPKEERTCKCGGPVEALA